MSATESFLVEIENYLLASKTSATAFGMRAVGDPGFVRGLRNGRSAGLSIVDKVRNFIRDNPAPVKAPAPAEAAE